MADCPESASRGPAARWIELADRIAVCGRRLHDDLSRMVGSRQLSVAQFSVLWACRGEAATGRSQSELAAAMAVSPAHVSGLVEQLRRKGFMEGHRSAADRRRQLWRPTPDGRETLSAILTARAEWLDAGPASDQHRALRQLADQLACVLDESTTTSNEREAA